MENQINKEFNEYLDKRLSLRIQNQAKIDSTAIPVIFFVITALSCLMFQNNLTSVLSIIAVLSVLIAMGMSIEGYEAYLKLFKSDAKKTKIKSPEFIEETKMEFISIEISKAQKGLEFVRNNQIGEFENRIVELQNFQSI